MTKNTSGALWNWFPVAIEQRDSSLLINWQFIGDHRVVEPFFEDTLAAIPHDQRFSCRTSAEALTQFDELDCLEPSASIFHSSRSGSTLISQLLATSDECIVIPEAPVIDAALELCLQQGSSGDYSEILKRIVRAFGQRRGANETHFIVKLDSWHIAHLELIRQIWPDAKLFFVYRHPTEILLSHRRQRGPQIVPGLLAPELVGLDSHDAYDPADLDGYCQKVVTNFFRSALRHAESGDLRLINYTQLPEIIWTQLAPSLSISQNDESIQLMRQRSSRHSKRSTELFAEEKDPEANLSEGDAINDSEQHYDALEQVRLTQAPW